MVPGPCESLPSSGGCYAFWYGGGAWEIDRAVRLQSEGMHGREGAVILAVGRHIDLLSG